MATGSKIKNNLVIQGDVTASAFSGDGSGLTGVGTVTDISYLATTASNSFISDQTITGSVVATGDSSRVRFLASTLSDLPSATDNHGMFAHVHATGLGYYAHAGNWVPLATSESVASIDVTPPSTYFNSSLLTTENISKNFNYTSSLNVVEITSSVEGAIIDYRLTSLDSGSRVGTFMYAHNGTNLSYNDITIPGAGIGADPILSATLTGSIVSLDIENAAGFNFSGFAKKFNILGSAIPIADPNAPIPLLDTYTGAAVAYSLRKLRVGYTGNAIRIRRDSDNAETDIGFDINGNLDTTAITSHCGSYIGYLVKWYDQSGNNRDLIGTFGNSMQAQIYDGYSIRTLNGKPVLKWMGGAPPQYNITNEISLNDFAISNVGSLTYKKSVYVGTSTSGMYTIGSVFRTNLPNGERIDNSFSETITYNTGQYVVFSNRLGLTLTTALNSTPGGNPSYTNAVAINFSGLTFLHQHQEFIIWDSDQSTNRTGIETNINNHYSIYATGLLEDYSGAAAAYSVRQLTTAFTSSMNIRRASDNAEQVIGFTANGDLDTGSIETFCAGTECYVDTWYDQSGNNRNAEENTTSYQPLIYSASAVITENNKPAIDFTGNPGFKVLYARQVLSQSHFCVAEFIDTGHGRIITQTIQGSGTYDWTGTNPYIPLQRSTTNKVGSNAGGYKASNSVINNSQNLFTSIHSGTLITNVVNNTSIATASSILSSSIELFQIKRAANQTMDGTLQEYILYDNNQLSNRTAIETNINSYFNIY